MTLHRAAAQVRLPGMRRLVRLAMTRAALRFRAMVLFVAGCALATALQRYRRGMTSLALSALVPRVREGKTAQLGRIPDTEGKRDHCAIYARELDIGVTITARLGARGIVVATCAIARCADEAGAMLCTRPVTGSA